jgi:RNA-binding protein
MTSEKRRQLRARAHALDPVVRVGQSGLSPAVLQEIERALKSHELIKIRVAGAGRVERERMLEDICAGAAAERVQHIGKILVVYRENPELAGAEAPKPSASPHPGSRKGARARRPTRSARR